MARGAVELRHSGSIPRKPASEMSDEELMAVIGSLAADVGLSIKTIDAAPQQSSGATEQRLLRPSATERL